MWETALLGDIATVIAGQSPQSRHYNKGGNGMPFYQGKKDYGKKYLNPPTVWTTKVTKQAIKGDILMSVRAPVGALNIATHEICIGRGLAAIRVNDKVTLDYLYLALLSVSDELVGSPGAVFNSINKEQVENIPLPLPPLVEQKRIATKLDSAFAEIDKAIASTERKKAEVVNLKRAVLVDKLSAQRDSVTVTIGELCTIANGGTPASKQSEYWGNGHQWLTPKDMGKLTSCYVSTTERQITDEGLNNSSAKVMPPKSVILSSRAPIGYVAVNTVPMAFNQGCRGLIPKDKITAEYLYYFLLSSRKLLDDLGAGTTFKELSTKALASIEFPLPQLAEQNRIVEKLDAIFTNIDKVANIATKQLANYQALKSAILKQELQGPTK